MRDYNRNPFRPTFGSVPATLAGRREIIDEIVGGINNDVGDPNRASILVGARGTGKTVLLTTIANEAESAGWISVNVTSGEEILNEIMVQVRNKASHILPPQATKRLSEIQVGPIGITIENSRETSTWRSEITSVLEELNRKNTGLLITVDEVSASDDQLKTLVASFQHFVREGRNVAIVLAGLPHNVSAILTDDRVSFLRRAFQRSLESIDVNETAYAIKETVEIGGRSITNEALMSAATASNGYAFLIQLIGYHMWRQNTERKRISADDVSAAITFAEADMKRMVFDYTYYELSEREKQFLTAMSEDDGSSRISDIASRMEIDTNNAVKIRKRLIEREVIGERGRGIVDFEIPMMRSYIRNNNM